MFRVTETRQFESWRRGWYCLNNLMTQQVSWHTKTISEILDTLHAREHGLTKEEAAERISFLDRFPMFPGMESFGPELQRMNVLRVYEELLARQKA